MIEQLKAGGFSVMIGDAVVGIAKTSTLSIDRDAKLEMDWSPSPIKLTGTAKIDGNDSLLEDFLSGMKFEVETAICEKMNLPRKTKKAYTSYYRRNTKWKRELNKWIMRSRHRLGPGEMVMTKDEAGRIEMVVNSCRNEATSVSVDSDTMLKTLHEKNTRMTTNGLI
jgi:hypothetical protein